MSNTNESQPATSAPGAPGSSSARILGQAGALVLAIGVVSYLIWHARATAEQQGDGGAGANVPAVEGGAGDQVMPSSKSRMIDADFFSNDGSDTVLNSSKSAVMPSSKFLVLPSSKSAPLLPEVGAPLAPNPTDENFRNPKPDAKPQQSVGGNKD